MSDFNMLGSLGVDVPCKVVKLSKPPSAFIAEGGGALAEWQKARGTAEERPAAGSVGRSSSCRRGRVHAHPMQRSHFSSNHPSSLAIDANDTPIHAPIADNAHHRRNPKPQAPVPAPATHPLEQHRFGKAHRNERAPLAALSRNNVDILPAAGAPSGAGSSAPTTPQRITRMPTPSNVDTIHGEARAVTDQRPPTPRLSGARVWTEERDRKQHDREFFARSTAPPATAVDHQVVGRERVLSATSPPRAAGARSANTAADEWHATKTIAATAARSGYTDTHAKPSHALPHMHKKLWAPEPGDASPVGARPAVGAQKSTLQKQWLRDGWWAGGGADEVEPKPQYRAPSPGAKQPSFGVPHYSKTLYEVPARDGMEVLAPMPQERSRPVSPAASRRRSGSTKAYPRWRH